MTEQVSKSCKLLLCLVFLILEKSSWVTQNKKWVVLNQLLKVAGIKSDINFF